MSNSVVFEDLSPDVVARLQSLYKEKFEDLARFGDAGYLLPAQYKPHADAVRDMPVRSSDVWLATFPRSDFSPSSSKVRGTHFTTLEGNISTTYRTCTVFTRPTAGTHMTAEMLWLLLNDLDYEKAAKIPLSERNIFIEIFSLLSGDVPIGYQVLAEQPSPRLISTHLAFSLLPPTLLDTTKVVYVARDPRDVAVSYYNFYKHLKSYGRFETFEQFWEHFVDDLIVFTPFFPHLKEAWALRNHPNMLFMFYEDIIKDMPSAVRRIGRFVGRDCSDDEVTKLSAHMDIKNMRNNVSVQPSIDSSEVKVFVRQGKAGGWRDHFNEDLRKSAQEWMHRHLKDTDITFPEY